MVATCGESGASSVTVQVALRSPAARGVKVTEMVQEALGAMVPEQLVEPNAKSGALLPPPAVETRWRGVPPVLVRVSVIGLLEEPWVTAPGKRTLAGEKVT